MIYKRWIKNGLDRILASLGIIVLSPVIIGVALAVRKSMGTPILYRQVRPGLNGEPFTILKFRTMTDATDENGQPLPDDQRLTTTGKLLRATSLDELPELLNVLRGDMSLVGPRPLLVEYLDHYTTEQARRHEILPGITGWAQINGRNTISWEEKFAYDVWYVEHCSLRLDIKIILFTLWKVFKREGISQQGHATMPEFGGSTHE